MGRRRVIGRIVLKFKSDGQGDVAVSVGGECNEERYFKNLQVIKSRIEDLLVSLSKSHNESNNSNLIH